MNKKLFTLLLITFNLIDLKAGIVSSPTGFMYENQNLTTIIPVAEALAIGESLGDNVTSDQEYAVVGYVSRIRFSYSSVYKNESFYISDFPNDSTNVLYVYRGKIDNPGADIGDKVVVVCKIRKNVLSTNTTIESENALAGIVNNIIFSKEYPLGSGRVALDYSNDGDSVVLNAIPNEGYNFIRWSDGVTGNPRTIKINNDSIIEAIFDLVDTGQCGEEGNESNLQWEFVASTGTLTITGHGAMQDFTRLYDSNDQSYKTNSPWYKYTNDIKTVILPNNLTYLGNYAFYNCIGLTSITIPSNISSITNSTFEGCTNLTSVMIKANAILNKTYTSTSNLKNIFGESVTKYIIGDSITNIGAYAFFGCSNVESIDIPNSVISIGTNAFQRVQNINYTGTATGAPWGALKLNGEQPIYSVSEIRAITSQLGTNVTSQDYYRFTGVISSISGVNTSYGNATFNITDGTNTFYCYRIHDYYSTLFTSSDQLSVGDTVVISSKVQNYKGTTPEATLGRLVYHSANPLFTPDSVFYYGHRKNHAGELKLYDAINIDTLDIPSSVSYNGQNYTVTEMASGAMYSKKNIKCIKFPKTLELMPRAFELCDNIQTIYYNPRNLAKPTLIPFSDSQNSIKEVYIGKDVEALPDEFFNSLTNITTIHWNATNCADMEYSPFYYSRAKIKDFIISNTISKIPANMCWGMTRLTEFFIPSSVTYIGKDAFHGCTNLTTLSLGENIVTYKDSVFAGCSNLTSIYNYRERPAKLGAGAFDGVDYFNSTLYVLANSVNMYKSSGSDWKDFYFVEPIGSEQTATDSIIITPHANTADIVWPSIVGVNSYMLSIYDYEDDMIICTLIFNANGQLTSIAFCAPTRKNTQQQTEQTTGFHFTVTGLNEASKYEFILQTKDAQDEILETYYKTFTTNGYKCRIRFVNWDGTVLQSSIVEGYTMPVYNGEVPTRPADENNTYTFSGWSPEITIATDDVTYTAIFEVESTATAIDIITDDITPITATKFLRNGQILILRRDKTYTLTGLEVK